MLAMTWQEHAIFADPQSGVGRIESVVLNKIGSRLSEFSVDEIENRLVLRGRASSYHVKQLVQHEVMEMTTQLILSNQIEVVN